MDNNDGPSTTAAAAPAEAQDESAAIWSRFSEIAAANDGAWIRKPATPADILTVDERNRPIAFP